MVTMKKNLLMNMLQIFQMKDGQIINIINNEENVKESNLNINLTKRKGNRKGKLPFN